MNIAKNVTEVQFKHDNGQDLLRAEVDMLFAEIDRLQVVERLDRIDRKLSEFNGQLKEVSKRLDNLRG